MNPTNPCKDQGLSLLYLSMHPLSSVMPVGTRALGSFPPKLFQNHPPDQPQLLAPLPNSHDCWCWAMGLHPPMWLSPTLPLLPNLVSQPQCSLNLMFPWPVVQCTAPVHCLCARCLGALLLCAAWVSPLCAAWALFGRPACARSLGALNQIMALRP